MEMVEMFEDVWVEKEVADGLWTEWDKEHFFLKCGYEDWEK